VYLGDLLNIFDVNGMMDAWQITFFALLAIVVTVFAYIGVRLSTRTALILEAITLTILGSSWSPRSSRAPTYSIPRSSSSEALQCTTSSSGSRSP
jgi:hypothetical protein